MKLLNFEKRARRLVFKDGFEATRFVNDFQRIVDQYNAMDNPLKQKMLLQGSCHA